MSESPFSELKRVSTERYRSDGMPTAKHTVFYAWQSDTPNSTGRSFIEKALEGAIDKLHVDSGIEPAERPTDIEVDRDTRGVPGSPPIAATIQEKIKNCAVFVGDLTFTGQSLPSIATKRKNKRYFPNPNVLLEYGYALKAHGNERIVAVMNTAYGPSDPLPHLPFDLKHLRAPLAYCLHPEASKDEKATVFKGLVGALADRLEPCLSAARTAVTAAIAPVPRFFPNSMSDPVEYFTTVPQLLPSDPNPFTDAPLKFELPKKSSVYLRLAPGHAVAPLHSELAAFTLVQSGNLLPMGTELPGFSPGRNSLGAIVYAAPIGGKLYNFTQLFLAGELVGLDLKSTQAFNRAPPGTKGFIMIDEVEQSCLFALMNFASFFEKTLKFPYPWQLECGLYRIQNFCISSGARNLGNVLQPNLVWSAAITKRESPIDSLQPFFARLWEASGVPRDADRDHHLARLIAR
jgi:hypothetical protein